MVLTRLLYFKVRKIRKLCVTNDGILEVDPGLFHDGVLHSLQSHIRENRYFIFPSLAQGKKCLYE